MRQEQIVGLKTILQVRFDAIDTRLDEVDACLRRHEKRLQELAFDFNQGLLNVQAEIRNVRTDLLLVDNEIDQLRENGGSVARKDAEPERRLQKLEKQPGW